MCALFVPSTFFVICPAAITNRVSTPYRLHFTDSAAVDKFFELFDNGEVSEIMANIEHSAIALGFARDATATIRRYGHWLFKIHMLTGMQCRARMLFVQIVWRSDHYRFEFSPREHGCYI